MTPERWSQIKEIFAAARETGQTERDCYLDTACGSDRELRSQVERLLAEDGQPSLPSPGAEFLRSVVPRLAPGDMLAHYRVRAELGQGGMGAVYRAFDTRLHREVAVKVLAPGRLADPERKARLLREARAASALSHPNIVAIYEVAFDQQADFIVMEYVEGKTLLELICGSRKSRCDGV